MKELVVLQVEERIDKYDCGKASLKCAAFCEAKKCCKKYKRGKRCRSCPKK